jgi:hypothetical protein
MFRIGVDRIAGERKLITGVCPLDGERGVFLRMALVCPRCGRLLGGI